MGVHGLWRLLDSFGTVIQPDSLKGKRVAVDASIWIAQFRARVAPGEDVEHKVLEGFLARILKLLFYGIKPVFVFDGHASAAKGGEHHRRMRLRAINAEALLKRRAKQILMAQVAAGTLDVAELQKAIQAVAEGGSTAAAAETEGKSNGDAANKRAKNSEISLAEPGAREEERVGAALHAPHLGKRRIGHPRHPRRRRRLAPDAVASRSTRHFLHDVEGLLEERTRHEACVLRNVLQHTSTSLFMGPRRAVEDDGEGGFHRKGNEMTNAAAALSYSSSSQRHVVDVDDGDHAQADAISVTDSGVDYDDVDGDAEGTSALSSSSSSSDCHAVSSSSSGNDDSVTVTMEKRSALSSRTPSRASSATLLHSDDLARFLSTLSQLTPPAPPAATAVAERNANEATVAGEDEHRTETQQLGEDVHRSTRPLSVLTTDDSPSAAVSVNSSGSTDSYNNETSANGEADEEGEEEEEESNSNSSGEEEESEEEEAEEEEGSNEGGENPVDAADLAWEPFTQRMNPALLLQHVDGSRPSPVAPPRTTAMDKTPNYMGSSAEINYDDGEFTPVKLGQAYHTPARPTVVVVNSSGDDDEGSSSSMVAVAGTRDSSDGARAAATTNEDLPSSTKNNRAAAGREEVALSAVDAPSSAAPRPRYTARSSVTVVPFELLRIVELLDCCGVPYVLSPAEADAQCAFLARNGLVDAVFTEDSDVLVHGATTVLRGFFSQSKNVVAYRQAELTACGITKTVLVALASLLGCDYTDGVPGIGLVGALEALVVAWTAAENRAGSLDSPLAVLHVLRRWRELVRRPPHSWHDVDDEMTVAQFALFDSLVAQWQLLEQQPSFPETQAVEAFYMAEVDADVTPFVWLPPDWHQIRIFAGALGALSSTWLVQRYELAQKEWLKREAEAEATKTGQRRLTDFGAQERVRAEWAYQKQPRRHAAVLSQLRAVQLIT